MRLNDKEIIDRLLFEETIMRVNVGQETVDLVEFSFFQIESLLNRLFPEKFDNTLSASILIKLYHQKWNIGNIQNFFKIYYDSINCHSLGNDDCTKQQRISWSFKGIKFYSFQDCLIACVLSKISKEEPKNSSWFAKLFKKFGSSEYYSVFLNHVEDLEYRKNRLINAIKSLGKKSNNKALEFVIGLEDNLSEYIKSGGFERIEADIITNNITKNTKKVLESVSNLFKLLSENKEDILPLIDDEWLQRFIPDEKEKSEFESLLQDIIQFRSKVSFVKNFVEKKLFQKNQIRVFAEDAGVYYEIITSPSKYELVIDEIPSIDSDWNEVLEYSCNLLKPKFRSLTVHDIYSKTTGKKQIKESVTVWLDFSGLDRLLEEILNKKKTLNQKSTKTVINKESKKGSRGVSKFTKMIKSLKVQPEYDSEEKLWNYLYSEASKRVTENQDFRNLYQIIEFEIVPNPKQQEIKFRTDESKNGSSMKRSSFKTAYKKA